MGLWRVPDKILLPAEPGQFTFAYNGRMPDGDQVMAYAQARYYRRGATDTPVLRGHTAVLFRFDADGVLKSVDFRSTWLTADAYDKAVHDESYRQARELLAQLVSPVKDAGWESADILVRPFYVVLDELATGLIYRTRDEDEGDESEYSPEEVRLVPFDKIFVRPWTTGAYDT